MASNSAAVAVSTFDPKNAILVVGQHVKTGLYNRGLGYVTAIHGEQNPASVGSFSGGIAFGGSASFDIVFLDGSVTNRLPESILRGVQWQILEGVASEYEIALAVAQADSIREQKEKTKAAEKAAYQKKCDDLRTAEALKHLNQEEEYSSKRAGKNIRIQLKRAFPSVKFSVRMDGHNSINVGWTDGPLKEAVKAIVGCFQCGFYDVNEDYHGIKSTPFGDVFGDVEFLFFNRDYSDVAIEEAVKAVNSKYAANIAELEDDKKPTVENYKNGSSRLVVVPGIEKDLASLIFSEMLKWDGLQKTVLIPAEDSQKSIIEEHTHTKHGFQMFIVVNPERVARDVFMAQLDAAKALGGWYSKKWGSTPAGFAFKDEAAAKSFAADTFGHDDEPTPPTKPTKKAQPKADSNTADKFRTLADKMQGEIDNKLANRLTNTPKRQREAGAARIEGERLKRTQEVLLKLADLHDAGTVPEVLKGIRSKKAVYELVGEKMDSSHCGYYDTPIGTGQPSINTPEALAVWELIKGKSEEEKRTDKIRKMEEKLLFSKIPGFFPTPDLIVDRMLELADINPDHKCLEPQAGSGAIADRIKGICKSVDCCEISSSLREILQLKGHILIADDFIEEAIDPIYDRIVMNPPFENLQEIDHVKKAFDFLVPGGRLVSVMSPAPFYRSDKKSTAFKNWFEDLDGQKIELPAGSFKESGTGVSTVIIVIDKRGED